MIGRMTMVVIDDADHLTHNGLKRRTAGIRPRPNDAKRRAWSQYRTRQARH